MTSYLVTYRVRESWNPRFTPQHDDGSDQTYTVEVEASSAEEAGKAVLDKVNDQLTPPLAAAEGSYRGEAEIISVVELNGCGMVH